MALESNNAPWCIEQLNMVDDNTSTSDFTRGAGMFVLMQATWADKRRVAYSPAEARCKAAVWEWFSALEPKALEKVSTQRLSSSARCNLRSRRTAGLRLFASFVLPPLQALTVHDKTWVDLLIKLEKQQQTRKERGVWVPSIQPDVSISSLSEMAALPEGKKKGNTA